MNKYIDSEKLIAEIERRIANGQDGYGGNLKALLLFITSLQQKQTEVDLDAIVNEAFDKYSSVDGYGQLSVSFNRAELYSFIKEIARYDTGRKTTTT